MSDLDTLADRSPIHSNDADLTFQGDGAVLTIEDSTHRMGLCIEEIDHSRALDEYVFRTGPYQVRVFRNSARRVQGPSYLIEVDEDE